MIRAGKLHGVKIGRVQYCVKREIIAYAAAPAHLAHPCGETYKALVAGYWKEREKQPGDCFAYSEQYELGQRIVSLSQFIMMWLHPYLIVRKHREKTEKGVQLLYTECSSPTAVDTIANGNDGIQVVKLSGVRFPVRGSCRDFLGN